MKFQDLDFLCENSSFRMFDCLKLLFDQSNWSVASAWLDWCSFMFDRSKRDFVWCLIPLDQTRLVKNWISAKFSNNYFERLKMFQTLWMVLWGIVTLYTYILRGYNPMGINRG